MAQWFGRVGNLSSIAGSNPTLGLLKKKFSFQTKRNPQVSKNPLTKFSLMDRKKRFRKLPKNWIKVPNSVKKFIDLFIYI